MWINNITNEYSFDIPTRIRLPDGLTKTGSDITEELLIELGWTWQEVEEYIPEIDEINTGTNATVGD
jgi:hypothetical protein